MPRQELPDRFLLRGLNGYPPESALAGIEGDGSLTASSAAGAPGTSAARGDASDLRQAVESRRRAAAAASPRKENRLMSSLRRRSGSASDPLAIPGRKAPL